jgi:hypothetical protein
MTTSLKEKDYDALIEYELELVKMSNNPIEWDRSSLGGHYHRGILTFKIL